MSEAVMAWCNFLSAGAVGVMAFALALETPAVPWLRVKRWLLGATAACGLGVAVSAFKLVELESYSPSGALWQLSAWGTCLRFAMGSVLLWELVDVTTRRSVST